MWKDIKGYEGLYQISDDGQVRRFFSYGTKPVKGSDGVYLTVSLSKNCIKRSFAIHRLVAEHFLEKPTGATEVNHKDGNKHNNHLDNLEWVTQKENFAHAINVLKKNPYGKAPRKVRCLDKNTGELVCEFESISAAARAVGKMSATKPIGFCCQGYQGSAYGYKWEYAD